MTAWHGIDYQTWSENQETTTVGAREMLEGVFRETRYDDPSEGFVDGMLAPWDSKAAIVSLSRNAIGTNTSHTTEIDPSEISARTLLLWGREDEFQPIEYAERLEEDISDAELVGLDEASHWVMADRPDAYGPTRWIRSGRLPPFPGRPVRIDVLLGDVIVDRRVPA